MKTNNKKNERSAYENEIDRLVEAIELFRIHMETCRGSKTASEQCYLMQLKLNRLTSILVKLRLELEELNDDWPLQE